MPSDDSRIARIQTFHLTCPLPEPWISAQSKTFESSALLVCVETASGAKGWGECAGMPALTQAAIQTFCGPLLIGRSVLDYDVLWHELYQAALPWGRRGVLVAALSGLDMAIWDLRGKLQNQSMSSLLGGAFRTRIPCYAIGQFFRALPESELIPALVEEAHLYVEQGYRAVKTRVGRNLVFDTALLNALRTELPNTQLAADADRAYDFPESISIGHVLDDLGYSWFEEPLSPEFPHLQRELASAIRTPLASGQHAQTRWDFQSLITSAGVKIVQPDMAYCGGPTEAVRIRGGAAASGLNVLPHSGGTQLNFAAALHFIASDFRLPGRIEAPTAMLGRDGAPNPLRDALFSQTIEIEGGVAKVPDLPGLGVTPDPGELHSFTVSHQEIKS